MKQDMGVLEKWKGRSKRAELLLKYMAVFNTDDGRAILADMCRTFHVFDSTMGDSPQETAFNEGARSVILRILKTINTDPEKLEALLREGQSDRRI